MNFGNTIEEQYAKISSINKLMKKFEKVTKILLVGMALAMSMLFFSISEEKIIVLVFAVIEVGFMLIFGGFFGRTYCWAWILLCEKYNPKHLAFSFANALDNSAVYGYVFGGSTGAKEASFGAAAVMVVFAALYLRKGQKYARKYKNLLYKELELKKQLDAKYGKTV